jgi:uncharacterized protein YbjT (DUF2867 family)
MSGYTNFAVAGAGTIGSYIVQQLLKDKAAGIIKEVIVLSRQVKYPSDEYIINDVLTTRMGVNTKGSKNTVQGDAKVIQVDYSNEASIKHALTGVDVVISTVPPTAFDVQWKIATAAKEVDVKLFAPSEYGAISEGKSEGLLVEKAEVQAKLKALGLPYTAFYTGAFADDFWLPYVS